MRRPIATAAVLVSTFALTLACGDEEPAPTGSTEPESVQITFSGGTVTPNGADVELEQGQDLELVVESDAAGELHVHTSPEQALRYAAGTTTLQLELDEPPGVVEVESHELDQVVLQLEIR